ncbi:sensor histidine kinase [Sorangium sp. So ce1128]
MRTGRLLLKIYLGSILTAAALFVVAVATVGLTRPDAHLIDDDGRPVAARVARLRASPLRRIILRLSAVPILLMVVAVIFARHLVRPLQRIASAATRFGQGELTARAGIQRSDEIGEVGRAFDDMADRVTRLMTAQQELLANVSHELQTPLTRIHIAVDLMADGSSDQAKELLPEIAHDLAELERLIDDVMMVARLDLSRSQGRAVGAPLRLESTSAEELVQKAASRFRGQHPTHELVVEVPPGLPALWADAMLVRRVLDNLLENARKYSEPGSTIRVSAAGSAAGVTIAITDSGIGIDEADLQHVFTPFFRSDRSRSRATGGVGLGLGLSRRIVEAHGGTIEIQSTPNRGTTVTLDLPTRPAAAQAGGGSKQFKTRSQGA